MIRGIGRRILERSKLGPELSIFESHALGFAAGDIKVVVYACQTRFDALNLTLLIVNHFALTLMLGNS